MEILISNDDGIHADGINVLAQNLSSLANILVVAPDRNRSGASNSLTLDAPLRTKNLAKGRISVEGTPTDCVHLAITGLFKELPDMVVAGINEGANLGDDILYSGTVAAATEGRFLGLPAMAVSLVCDGGTEYFYETAARVAERMVKRIIVDPLPVDTILNINVPNIPLDQIQGYEVTRLGTRHRAEPITERIDPRGRKVYWVGLSGPEEDAGPGTDFHAIRSKKVSITPLKIDLTHYQAFEQLASWIENLND